MNTVVLIPNVNTIEYGCFDASDPSAPVCGTLHSHADDDDLNKIVRAIAHDAKQPMDAIALAAFVVRLPYSASVVTGPTIVSQELIERLETLIPDAPLHLPRCIELIRACVLFAAVPVTVVSETGYFVDLPDEEAVYALDFKLQQQLRARRYGFHGIYHRHACMQAMHQLGKQPADEPKIISICLEPRPELAASVGLQPVMVSGGMTPLEGLCGLTACGDIDPGIVLEVARNRGWSLERINRCLGQESGMRGLVGRPVTWESLFDENDPQTELARRVFQYQLLRYCGAAVSAMGGLDAVVFSGRGSANAAAFSSRLVKQLQHLATPPLEPILVEASMLQLVYFASRSAVNQTVRLIADGCKPA